MARVLVFTRTTGYRHASIPAGVRAVRELGEESGFGTDATEDPAVFAPERLARYRAVVFLSTSGEVFDDAQRAALEGWVRGGGGYVGVHAASTTEYGWPFYGELVGARFDRHPEVQRATVLVEDRGHPATAHLGGAWTRVDEWYDHREPPPPDVRVLLSVDESTYAGGRTGPVHPVAWCREIGRGRSFYTALGHTAESFADPDFRAHLLGGVRYAIGG